VQTQRWFAGYSNLTERDEIQIEAHGVLELAWQMETDAPCLDKNKPHIKPDELN
jgi:hypothetical protein